MKTGVEYLRYSSDRQTEQSIEGQKRVCDEFAKRNDIVIVDTYIDRAMTGTNDNREAFQQMLKDSDKKAWDFVLVYKLDRFSRNKYEMAIHRKHLKDNGIKILSAMENIPDTPEGILLESLLEGMNQYYSEELSQKTKRGMNETRLKGNFIGGIPNYGYSLKEITADVNGKQVRTALKVIVNEEEAPILKAIFTDYSNGKRICDIVKELTERGVLNRGKPFLAGTIYSLLQQEKYTGIYRLNGAVYDKIYPQIIPPEPYETVRKRIDANKYGKHVPGIDYLLKGRIFCGYCGNPMYSYTGTSCTGKINRYYKCRAIKKNTPCDNRPISKEVIERFVAEAVTDAITDKANLALLMDRIISKQRKQFSDDFTLRSLQKELAKTNKAISNIMNAIEAGIFTETTKARLQELEIFRKELGEKILIEGTKTKEALQAEDIEKYLKEAIKLKPKSMIELLVEKVVVFTDRAEVFLKYSPDSNETNSPDGNNSGRGCFIVRYDKSIEKPKVGRRHRGAPLQTYTAKFIIALYI